MKKLCFLANFFVAILWVTSAFGAEFLDDVFQKAETAPWGSSKAELVKKLPGAPLAQKNDIFLLADSGLSAESTINYLFTEETGKFYNLAWYVATPISDIAAALKLEKNIEKAVTAKYGKPQMSYSDGKAKSSKRAEKDLAEFNRKKTEFFEETKKIEEASGSKMTGKELASFKSSSGVTFLDIMPSIFYSKLGFWDGGNFWVSTNLLCSTDGTCYQHLQFASKAQTGKSYLPTPQQPFSYSPWARDQDMVTSLNRGLEKAE
jgi:hypothetical protein